MELMRSKGLWQGVVPPQASQGGGAPVQAELPGRRVPFGRNQVAPVLDDEPEPRQRRQCRRQPELDIIEERADCQHREDREPKVILVDPAVKDVDPWPERVSLEAEHPLTLCQGNWTAVGKN